MFWHGGFADMTNMWEGRGEWQNLSPLGDLIARSGAPDFSILPGPKSPWPDSLNDSHKILPKGYSLDHQGWPTFDYLMGEATIEDGYRSDKRSLVRTTKITGNDVPVFQMIASGSVVENLGKGRYAVQGPGYQIQIKSCNECSLFLRQTAKGQELVASISPGGGNISTEFSW